MSKIQEVFDWLKVAGVEKVEFDNTNPAAIAKFELWWNLMQEELEETKEAFEQGDLKEFLNGLADLFFVLHNAPVFFNIKGDYIIELDKVVTSNYTKFCKTEEKAQETVDAYKLGEHPNKKGEFIDCYYEQVAQFYVVKRSSDNKIMKSISFMDTNEL